jgi:hypothetical protein
VVGVKSVGKKGLSTQRVTVSRSGGRRSLTLRDRAIEYLKKVVNAIELSNIPIELSEEEGQRYRIALTLRDGAIERWFSFWLGDPLKKEMAPWKWLSSLILARVKRTG